MHENNQWFFILVNGLSIISDANGNLQYFEKQTVSFVKGLK